MSLLTADIGKKLMVIGIVVVIVMTTAAWMVRAIEEDTHTRNTRSEQRKEVVCPSFLSIARSARDTMIVMRNEPLCRDYVLDNLK